MTSSQELSTKDVFISHSSQDEVLINALTELLSTVSPSLTISASSGKDTDRPATGSSWFNWIIEQTTNCRVAIILLTPRSVANEWVMWETGTVYATAFTSPEDNDNRVLPVLVGLTEKQLPGPLKEIQVTKGDGVDEIKELLKTIVTRCIPENTNLRTNALLAIGAEAEKGFKSYLDKINKYIKLPEFDLIKKVGALRSELGSNEGCIAYYNPVLATVYSLYLDHVRNNICDWGNKPLIVPSNDYPHYLIKLQEKTTYVKAVAIVDEIEGFWAKSLGDRILNGSKEEYTQRVFSFKSLDHLVEYAHKLLEHASEYKVKVISDEHLGRRFSEYNQDFSIIRQRPNDNSVVAHYVSGYESKGIQFTVNPVEVNLYENAFQSIWAAAQELPVTKANPESGVFKSWMNSVFENRQTEMSKYIEVEKYERYELLHPYFKEMMRLMLDEFKKNRKKNYCKVLEVGAGTGHFTTRIAEELGNSGSLMAMEYDFNCFTMLCRKFPGQDQTRTILNEDSSLYDPPGKFDFIFSSFADHHIARPDAISNYLVNIKRNLHPGSSFIVGDEFLPEYSGDEKRNQAIDAYHNHIIEEARRQMNERPNEEHKDWEEFIKLEDEARKSGIKPMAECGDYKVPLNVYLERLKQAGLEYDPAIPIGPSNKALREQVGGIYVIRAFLPK